MCLSHESLVNYYQTNFQLMQHHKYRLEEIDTMIPWEKEIYVTLLLDYLKEEELRQKQKNGM